ncbi:hypothetical protein K449DRAFT_436500 [Hypoxylon sp. EC38]|nr:hypothetical protein K449DRAFT_436500 [Hypoxylon sp. EC38]
MYRDLSIVGQECLKPRPVSRRRQIPSETVAQLRTLPFLFLCISYYILDGEITEDSFGNLLWGERKLNGDLILVDVPSRYPLAQSGFRGIICSCVYPEGVGLMWLFRRFDWGKVPGHAS